MAVKNKRKKGNLNEAFVRKLLEDLGYYTVRSSKSEGLFDIWACTNSSVQIYDNISLSFSDNRIHPSTLILQLPSLILIQVKTNSKPQLTEMDRLIKFINYPEHSQKILAIVCDGSVKRLKQVYLSRIS